MRKCKYKRNKYLCMTFSYDNHMNKVVKNKFLVREDRKHTNRMCSLLPLQSRNGVREIYTYSIWRSLCAPLSLSVSKSPPQSKTINQKIQIKKNKKSKKKNKNKKNITKKKK